METRPTPALTRLDPASRSDGVFEQLRGQILMGAFPEGSRLPTERELATTFGVNRASVREALRRLEALELVSVRHGQGIFVGSASTSSALQVVEALLRDPRTVTSDLLRQILVFRRDVSIRVVELAAVARTSEHVERGRALLAAEERTGSDPERALDLDVQMNALVGEASGNPLYPVVTNLFTKLGRRLGPLYYNERRASERSLATHRALLAAIEARDAREARRIVELMLDYSEQAILATAARLEADGVIGPDARGGGA